MMSSTEPTFRTKNRSLVATAIELLEQERPMTLRQLYYRCVSAGALENSQKEYRRLGPLMTRVREDGQVPRSWIVDHVRATLKPSSWSGLEDFGDTVRDAYRKDLWARQFWHIEVFVEKDAVAGTIQPVTHQFDVALRVCRGYSSVSFAGGIADEWSQIQKSIAAFYLGDFDPIGHDIARDLIERLERYSGRIRGAGATHGFGWQRLGVIDTDFEAFDLIALPVRAKDVRSQKWRKIHGERCAEVDAIAPTELRRRVEEAIDGLIDQVAWTKLQEVERIEQEALAKVDLGQLSGDKAAGGTP